jgi:hypothetical protein
MYLGIFSIQWMGALDIHKTTDGKQNFVAIKKKQWISSSVVDRL